MHPLLEQHARLTRRIVEKKKTIRRLRAELSADARAVEALEAECRERGLTVVRREAIVTNGTHPGAEETHGRLTDD